MCIGDFNEVLRPEEHDGIADRSNAQVQAFRDAVDVCMLMDLGYQGGPGLLRSGLQEGASAGSVLTGLWPRLVGQLVSLWPLYIT